MKLYSLRLLKKMRSKIFSFALLVFLSHINWSCTKLVEVSPPMDQLVSSTVYKSDGMAVSAIRGIYSSMINDEGGFASGNLSSVGGRSADEFQNFSTGAAARQFSENNLAPDNLILRSLWQTAYKYIYASNLMLENLEASTMLTPAVSSQLKGEAKFIRAFCNFYLVNLFGDVPLILGTDYRLNAVAPRAPASQVYQQIIADLIEAKISLVDQYPTVEKVRPNKGVAIALLARAYLFTDDWVNAEAEATTLINNTAQYSLATDMNEVFLKNSVEAIWQLIPIYNNQHTSEAYSFILTGMPTAVTIGDDLKAAFADIDKRKTSWIKDTTINGNTYYYPYKYRVIDSRLPRTEYSMVLRLAEQYLIRAEARAHQNDILGAQEDLNAIRARAGMGNSTANDKESLLLAIELERRLELFSEWGHRWLDLKRTNRASTVLAPIKGSSWHETDVLYPIPLNEIINNSNITQNAGY